MKGFKVKFQGAYLVKTPYWDGGTWTSNESEALIFDKENLQFFKDNYPQFEILVVPESISKEIMIGRKFICALLFCVGVLHFFPLKNILG